MFRMFGRRRYRRRNGFWAALRAFPAFGRVLVWISRILLLALVVDLVYVATLWPDWTRYERGSIPSSKFIQQYLKTRKQNHNPPLRWHPVPFSEIPEHLRRAVVVAEDSRFYWHHGFDFIAFKDAMDYNLKAGRAAFGGSTISQQTAKNLFLSARRDPLRKWHELLLTWGMEHHLKKNRILELYLNVAEFGRGIYGVDAASQFYWNLPVSKISERQAIELAATLPAPKKENPADPGKGFLRRVEKISGWMKPPETQTESGAAEKSS